MTAGEALGGFVHRVLTRSKAQRFAFLIGSRKGEQRILSSLDHDFELAIRADVEQPENFSPIWDKPCYIFHASRPFGTEAPTVQEAYEELSPLDGWLILTQDGSAAIFRPEGRWDTERLLSATHS
jgi:hypothetical protein